MSAASPVGRQIWALIRRYCIHERRGPILALIKFVAWPSVWMWLFYKYIIKPPSGPSQTAGRSRDESAEMTIDVAAVANQQSGYQSPRGVEVYLSLLLIFTISLQMYYYVVYMVTDKSSGMKSLMMSVGLRRVAYYLANFICFMTTALPLVILIAILSATYLFQGTETSKLVIVTVFVMFILHVAGLIFVFNSLLRIPSMSSLLLIASVLEYFVHDGVLKVAEFAPNFIFFLASADPYESVKLFSESFKTCNNNGETLIDGKTCCVSTNMLLIAMVFWTLASYIFGIWFDKACPWQTDTANQGLFYCLRSSAPENESNHVELSKRSHQSKYFESSVSNGQVGITIKNVSKEFSGKSVLEGINFKIFRGQTTLLLGHNGAGKTTLMNIILGKLMPNQGHVTIDRMNGRGTDNGIGVCPQTSVFDTFLSVRQHMNLFSDIKSDLEPETREQDIDRTLFDVSLDRKSDSLPSELSGGMKRKLSLGMAFVGKSSILILDEPSSGLDPDSRVFVWNAIRRYRADRTVLLSTQHMEEADYLGDRIAILSKGKIICCGSSVFLTKTFGSGYKLRVECLESRRQSIIELARRYFTQAKQADNEHIVRVPGLDERILDMVLELKDDKNEDTESNLINLLEHIERNLHQLGIKSHGLKSSSIEDVLLNTATLEDEDSVSVPISSSRDLIPTLINPLTVSRSSVYSEQVALFKAFLLKHVCTYKNDWISLLVFRVLIVGAVIWRLAGDLDKEKYFTDYAPTLVTFAMIFHFSHYPIVERASGFKTMQMTSLANPTLYWLSQLSVDMLTIVLATGLVCFYTRNLYTATGLLMVSGATLLFGLAAAFNCYVMSCFFKESGSALAFAAMYYLFGDIMTEFLFLLFGATFDMMSRTIEWSKNWRMVSVILFPTDALRFTYHGIILNGHIQEDPDFPPMQITEDKLPPLVTGLCSLAGQTIFFAGALYLIERYSLDPSTWAMSIWIRCRSLCCGQNGSGARMDNHEIDDDVQNESQKASTAIDRVPRDKYSLVAHNLSKSYTPPTKAVDQMSFTVNRGECFGLLGVNGAGKSTTFSMLVGERRPDTGKIWINGRYVHRGKTAYMQKLGYDPQGNPTMSLTPTEALFLMARLRRVNGQTIPTLVKAILEVLDMSIHAHKKCNQLSGGTMRKLALGMALIGNAELLLLDEPTAGVDPVARRSIWQLLHDLKARKDISIVITSHAMEECEAICDRISIMACGRLRCIGTFLHLRTKFSQGCTVRIQFSPSENLNNFASKIVPDLANRLRSFVRKTVDLVDTNVNSATYNISTSEFKHSALFKLLRDFKQQYPSITYMVNDSSLEDIFINMAQEQQRLSDQSSAESSRL